MVLIEIVNFRNMFSFTDSFSLVAYASRCQPIKTDVCADWSINMLIGVFHERRILLVSGVARLWHGYADSLTRR